MTPEKKSKSIKSKVELEPTLAKIESLISLLEHNDTGLEEALVAFEKGVKLVRAAQTTLDSADQKISLLIEENNGIIEQTLPNEGTNSV
jgi:exodeoxyribonuclease VII small subunit